MYDHLNDKRSNVSHIWSNQEAFYIMEYITKMILI